MEKNTTKITILESTIQKLMQQGKEGQTFDDLINQILDKLEESKVEKDELTVISKDIKEEDQDESKFDKQVYEQKFNKDAENYDNDNSESKTEMDPVDQIQIDIE